MWSQLVALLIQCYIFASIAARRHSLFLVSLRCLWKALFYSYSFSDRTAWSGHYIFGQADQDHLSCEALRRHHLHRAKYSEFNVGYPLDEERTEPYCWAPVFQRSTTMLSRYVGVSSFNRYISYLTSMALPGGNTLNIGSGHLAEAPTQMQSYPLVSSIVKIYLWWAAPVTTIAWCAFRFSQYRYHLIRDGPVASCITSTVAWFGELQRTVKMRQPFGISYHSQSAYCCPPFQSYHH